MMRATLSVTAITLSLFPQGHEILLHTATAVFQRGMRYSARLLRTLTAPPQPPPGLLEPPWPAPRPTWAAGAPSAYPPTHLDCWNRPFWMALTSEPRSQYSMTTCHVPHEHTGRTHTGKHYERQATNKQTTTTTKGHSLRKACMPPHHHITACCPPHLPPHRSRVLGF